MQCFGNNCHVFKNNWFSLPVLLEDTNTIFPVCLYAKYFLIENGAQKLATHAMPLNLPNCLLFQHLPLLLRR
jgi:hypothetical protein